jgi:isopenicillin N synthase-like dioxygenase
MTFNSELEEKGFAEVKFPISDKEMNEAAKVFLEFLTLDQEIKEAIHVRKRGESFNTGYVKRKKEDGRDNKEYFHYHPILDELFPELKKSENTKITKFFEVARKIHDAAYKLNKKIVSELADDKSLKKFYSKEKRERYSLRFLKYDKNEPGNFLASGHYDQGVCTLALAESHPGLRIHDVDVVHDNGKAIFMPGLLCKEINSSLKPAWHEVIQKEESSEGYARWAIVFFWNTIEKIETPYKKRHERN